MRGARFQEFRRGSGVSNLNERQPPGRDALQRSLLSPSRPQPTENPGGYQRQPHSMHHQARRHRYQQPGPVHSHRFQRQRRRINASPRSCQQHTPDTPTIQRPCQIPAAAAQRPHDAGFQYPRTQSQHRPYDSRPSFRPPEQRRNNQRWRHVARQRHQDHHQDVQSQPHP